MDGLEQPSADQHANTVVCRLERPDARKPLIPPNLEPVRELQDAALMVEATDAQEVLIRIRYS